MHPKNRHHSRYDLKALVSVSPELAPFVILNPHDASRGETIDFANPLAVKALNTALLRFHYGVEAWDLPPGFLCPPIPGRADMIHHLADLVGPISSRATVLDIGTGANLIYPLIGHVEYGWRFVASDIDPLALKNAEMIIDANPRFKTQIELRRQMNPKEIFKGIVHPGERFDLSLCNPPFHASAQEARAGSVRKWKNLGRGKHSPLNFGGQSNELWCEGGESAFIATMIDESVLVQSQVRWFSTLVSKEDHLPALKRLVNEVGAKVQIIQMEQGQKVSRVLSWTFGRS